MAVMGTMIMLGFGAVLLLMLLFYWGTYNALIGKRNQVENVFASLDALLKKRYDLIPNLVATVKNYMQHENETLTKVTELRARAESGNLTDDQKVDLDNQISGMMGRIMVQVEAYPDLKANENFMHLQRSLNEVEEQISAGRRAYNSSVTDYNNAIEMFPSSIVAGMHNFQKKKWFEASPQERESVSVAAAFES